MFNLSLTLLCYTSPMVQFDDIFTTYRFPDEARERMESAFKGVLIPRIAYDDESGSYTSRFTSEADDARRERTYRALARYAANELMELPESGAGELNMKIAALAAGETHGLLLQGVSEETPLKAMFMWSFKTLLGDNESFDNWFQKDIPQVVKRQAPPSYNFHRDGNIDNLEHRISQDFSSFFMLGSAQSEPLLTGTLFKLRESPDAEHVAHTLQPDEIIIADNRGLKHATGIQQNQAYNPRSLLRYTLNITTLSHSLEHGEHVKRLFAESGVPQDQAELKEWLVRELSELGKGRGR